MAAKRINPTTQVAKREELRRQLEDPAEISLGMMPLGPSDLLAISRGIGLSVNAVTKLAKICEAGGITKASAAAVEDAAILLNGTGRSIEVAVRDVANGARRILKGRTPRVGSSVSDAALIKKHFAPTQAQTIKEAAQAKRDLLNPPTERALEIRAKKAADKLAAREAEQAALTKTLKMRSTPGDELNKAAHRFDDEIEQRNYRGHRPPPFDEREIARGTESPQAFKEMKKRHHPATKSEIHGHQTAKAPAPIDVNAEGVGTSARTETIKHPKSGK